MIRYKEWQIGSRADPDGRIAGMAARLGIRFPTALLLSQRGYGTPEEAASFIRLETEVLRDPFLLPDMDRACDRILTALARKEKIVIYGDYDVDGVTAVSLLCLYLREKGADVGYYIPNRVGEGYGINCEALQKLAEEGASLFITVDTGVTAVEEVAFASRLGCDTVITDHHECRTLLPDAVAVINPRRPDSRYPFRELAGVGVAFKLVTALEYTLRRQAGKPTENFLSDICRRYIDLVALGTVADVMALRDENRLIVSMGLRQMEISPRPGVRALLEAAESGKNRRRKPITASIISYTLAPRINAAGRLSSASRAAELFLTDDSQKAAAIAEELCETNRRRQTEENKIVDEIQRRIEADPRIGASPVIVLDDDGWNHGVIGIVSSRITEKYGRPSILISFEGDVGKGSGRSVKGMDLVAALTSCSDLLIRYGGHELAAGLSVRRENLPALRDRLNAYAAAHLGDEEPISVLPIDCELLPEEITLAQAEELSLLEPCGTANPVPLFFLGDLTVVECLPIGLNRHSKFLLEKDGARFSAVCFGKSPEELCFAAGDRCDIAFQLTVNEFQNVRSEQLLIRDIRLTAESDAAMSRSLTEYRDARDGDGPLSDAILPRRDDFIGVYLKLKRHLPDESGTVCLHLLLNELNATPGPNGPITYTRLRLTLDILAETGVIGLKPKDLSCPGREQVLITIPNLDTKVNLEKSCLYRQLTARTTLPT